jgi:glutathione-regulated potassium-efflux system ancillary protein KefF
MFNLQANAMILVIHAHPYPQRSRACDALLRGLQDLPNVQVRSLYSLYPDFDIDVAAEQEALTRADLVVWLHPLYWYSPPAMLKHWFDVVLLRGWAYGDGGTALAGKSCLWVPTTGGDAASYSPGGAHGEVFANFVYPVERTARFCGMHWQEPLVVHAAHTLSDQALQEHAGQLTMRLKAWTKDHMGVQSNHD